MYNWMKWLRLLGGWHFIAATAIKPPKAACQFAADDILLYEFCYYNPMDLLHHLEKGKEELSPLQYHIKSLNIISRHYKKSLLRSQIYHGYEELSTDTNYPIWRRQERRSKYAVQLASWGSWDQILQRCPSVCLQTTWFPEHKSSFLWNFNFKFRMHVDGGHKQKPIDFQWRHFQNGCLASIWDFLVSGL